METAVMVMFRNGHIPTAITELIHITNMAHFLYEKSNFYPVFGYELQHDDIREGGIPPLILNLGSRE